MNFIRTAALAISSGFGIGWLPAGGTLITLPLLYLLIKYSAFFDQFLSGAKWHIGAAVYTGAALLIMGLIQLVENSKRRYVVIDHILGITISLLLIPISWKTVMVAFVLYRFYDIIKPWPVYQFTNIDGGAGAVLDDIFSGVLTSLTLQLILFAYQGLMSYL